MTRSVATAAAGPGNDHVQGLVSCLVLVPVIDGAARVIVIALSRMRCGGDVISIEIVFLLRATGVVRWVGTRTRR